MIPRAFTLCSIILISTNYVAGYKSSLTFVIDDTYSMSDDIDEVKLGVNAIFDTVLRHANASQIANFLLVTFNDIDGDPGVNFRINTKDREEFRNALSAIDVNGGGDCPEFAMAGIKRGLEESLDRSYIYVFTDATAKDYKDYEELKAIAIKKQSQIVFVLTGQCGESPSSPAYQVYHGLAKATDGVVYHMEKHEVGKILDFVKTQITGRRATLVVEDLPPGTHNMTFHTDVIMGEITLSLASSESASPSVKITAPDGSDVWKKILVETDQIKVYSVDVTMPGAHTVEVNSKAETRAVVSARSGVDFEHGFSAFKLPSLVDTKTRPAPGTKSHLSIKLNEGDVILQTVQILDMDDNVQMELPLEVVDNGTKFYTTPAFDPPETMFKIAIIAYDPKSNSNITRMATTPVETARRVPGENRRPSVVIEGEPIVNAEYDKPLQLLCKVNGYPQPTIQWRNKNTGTVIPGEVSAIEPPYEYMSVYSIEKVQESAAYECGASNSVGSDAKQVFVTTIVRKKFIVVDSPNRITVDFEREGQISCLVDAYPPADITWFKKGHKLIPSANIKISHDKSVVTIKHATPSDEGKYMCQARNRDNRKRIYRYVIVRGTEKPEIDKDTKDVTVKKGSSVVLKCKILKGIPTPSIYWYHALGSNLQQVVEKEEWRDKEDVPLIISGRHDTGSYTCKAENDVGSDFHETTLHLEYPPTIAKGAKSIKAASGSKLSIPCHADGGPTPQVTWYKDDVQITKSEKIYIFGDQTLRLVAQLSDSGNYTCKATNVLGSVNKTVNVQINVPVIIRPPKETQFSTLVGSSLKLPCDASGYPKPALEWVYRSFSPFTLPKTIRSTERALELNHIQISEEGYYTCTASNAGGNNNITFEVHVIAPPSIKDTYLNKRFEAVEGDRALRIACEVTGNPKPEITWTKDGLALALGSDPGTYFVEKGALIIKNVPKFASGAYRCEAKNSLGSAQEIFEVEVLDYPPPSPPDAKILVEERHSADIDCAAPHTPMDQLRWYKNGRIIKSGKLTLRNALVRDSGDYTCRVGNIFKSVSSTTRVIVGSKPELTISGEDEDIELVEGPPIILSCENRGYPKPTVEWYLDSNKLNGSDPDFYFEIDMRTPGIYKCIVNNSLGSITKTFNVFPRDCFVDTKKISKQHPLMFTTSLEWPLFGTSEDFMIFSKGEQLNLFCPTRFKMFPKQIITAFCNGGMNILINGREHDYADIQCTEEVKHTVVRTGEECVPGNTEKLSIGYKIADVNAAVYEICFNKTSETPIYAKHIMRNSLDKDGFEGTWKDSDQFKMNFNQLYDCKMQRSTISAHLRRMFHNSDECCFDKRQLVSSKDVFPGAPQESTLSYYNAIPHWSTCNKDNWEEVERRVRKFASESYDDLLVFTGTAKELSLATLRGMTNHFLTDRRNNRQPVPLFLWKMIQDPASSSSLAIIQVNVPDLRPTDISKYILCNDKCEQTDWMSNPDWKDLKKGYTYCCSLEEFEAAFGFKGVFEPDMGSLLTADAYVLPESGFTA